MLTTSEQQELSQIERDMRDTDRGLAWRLTMLQGMLRWPGPGRRACLPLLAVLVAALLRLVAAAGRLLMTFAEAAVLAEPTALMALGDAGWAGWKPGQAPGHSASPAQGRPRADETGLR